MVTNEQIHMSNALPIPYVGVRGGALEPGTHTIPYLAEEGPWSLEAVIIYCSIYIYIYMYVRGIYVSKTVVFRKHLFDLWRPRFSIVFRVYHQI